LQETEEGVGCERVSLAWITFTRPQVVHFHLTADSLPVMRDFLEVSRDLYYTHNDPPEENPFKSFGRIFAAIERLHSAKSHYALNLLNIEEILSMLEMMRAVGAPLEARAEPLGIGVELFKDYIRSTIEECTPKSFTPGFQEQVKTGGYPTDAAEQLFGEKSDPVNAYGNFVAGLAGVGVLVQKRPGRPGTIIERLHRSPEGVEHEYSIVTLNYDLLIERLADHIDKFDPANAEQPTTRSILRIAKLHGSVEEGQPIVPPTWRKGEFALVEAEWSKAYKWLTRATQIRVIGYSLPRTDVYMRYLLGAAAVGAQRLKRIDVITNDPKLRSHYERFVCFENARYAAVNAEDYVDQVVDSRTTSRGGSWKETWFAIDEKKHDRIMDERRIS